ncbi:MAG TPA: SPOR domain-containing protein [Acetobacteraceae bacterium]|nr:SPOR domain-containing protein [Acetobacteraceae bacterium]
MSDDLSIPNPSYRNGDRAGRYNRAAKQQRRPGMDPDTRRLVLFAGGVGSVLLLLIAASVVTSRHAGQVPVVTASSDPIRVKPDNPGGLHVATAESDVFSGGSDTKNARLAPAAEKPDPQALQADDESPAQPALTQKPAPAGPSAFETPAPTKPVASAAKDAVAPLVKPSTQAAAPAIKPAAPAARPQEAHAATTPAKQPEAHPTAHSVMVQLAAMTTESGAKEEWQRLTKRYADIFDGRTLSVSKTERDGRTFWRVRTGGFSDVAQAHAFCDKLRGKSSGCSIVEF